ncbi:hypothetical protein SAMN06295905_3654 [Devosia lucknowensis]|uniref:DUF1254 domain-containing protein n=1 Tax=Devosia lucknowensis TaxID=1096929 RepID=A0A1Y6GEV2_9HYPH|nr:hypothetical protein [Devosia lucknowensis]SMQ86350.1 hypothetical protein SAMN06295905_3654 [Devosia lucknowensis]
MRRVVTLSIILSLFSSPGFAQDAQMQAFTDFRTAVALDDRCHFLAFFERHRLGTIEEKLLEPLSFYEAYKSGKLTDEQYYAQLDGIDTEASAVAGEIDCADPARTASMIVPLRGEIALQVYADLMIAYQLGEISAEQQNAAMAYENMISPLYGEANWPGFVQSASQLARTLIDEANVGDTGYSIFGDGSLGGLGGTGGLIGDGDPSGIYADGESGFYLKSLIDSSLGVTDTIVFEMIAQQFGYRRIESSTPGENWFRDQLATPTFEPVFDLLDLPGRYEALGMGTRFYAVLGVSMGDEVRLMTFGEGADRMRDGTVTFLLHPPKEGVAIQGYDLVRSQEWWDGATRYEGELVIDTCLGGPCFALPTAFLEALSRAPSGTEYRFYFSDQPDGFDTIPEDPRIQSGWNYKAVYRRDMLEAGL